MSVSVCMNMLTLHTCRCLDKRCDACTVNINAYMPFGSRRGQRAVRLALPLPPVPGVEVGEAGWSRAPGVVSYRAQNLTPLAQHGASSAERHEQPGANESACTPHPSSLPVVGSSLILTFSLSFELTQPN